MLRISERSLDAVLKPRAVAQLELEHAAGRLAYPRSRLGYEVHALGELQHGWVHERRRREAIEVDPTSHERERDAER